MATLDGEKFEVDIIQPSDSTSRASCKRGRRQRQLPEELIRQLASEGRGSKAIVTRLKTEGIDVSYKTIQRVLSGERK